MTYTETSIKIKALKKQIEKLDRSLFKYLKEKDEVVLDNGDSFKLLELGNGRFKISGVVNKAGDKVKKRQYLNIEDVSKVVSINGELV